MKGLRSILGDSVKSAGGTRRVDEVACQELWPSVVGEAVADATRADRLRDGTLIVIARTSVWVFELTFHKEEITRLLNERLGRPLVRDIWFKVGSVAPPASAKPAEPEAAATGAAPEAALSERARAQVERHVAAIKDERIRDRARRLLVREAQRLEQKQLMGWKECPRCGTLHPESHKLCPLCRLHIRT